MCVCECVRASARERERDLSREREREREGQAIERRRVLRGASSSTTEIGCGVTSGMVAPTSTTRETPAAAAASIAVAFAVPFIRT